MALNEGDTLITQRFWWTVFYVLSNQRLNVLTSIEEGSSFDSFQPSKESFKLSQMMSSFLRY